MLTMAARGALASARGERKTRGLLLGRRGVCDEEGHRAGDFDGKSEGLPHGGLEVEVDGPRRFLRWAQGSVHHVLGACSGIYLSLSLSLLHIIIMPRGRRTELGIAWSRHLVEWLPCLRLVFMLPTSRDYLLES
jgi:hypothetical protein